MAQNIDAYNKNGGVNHNGNDRISVAVPHDVSQWGALNIYILGNGMSFKVQNCQYTLASSTNDSSEYFDEAFIDGKIPIENISGIIVSTEMRTKKISELSAIGVPANNEVVNITKNIVAQLQSQGFKQETFSGVYELIDEYTTISNNTTLDFLEQDKQLIPIRKKIDSILSIAIEKLYKQKCRKENISVLDVIELYNNRNLPIYDESDIVKECNANTIQEFSINEIDKTQESENQEANATTEDKNKDILQYETIQKSEMSLMVIPEKKRITNWFKEIWTSIKEKFHKDRNTIKKQDEEIHPNNKVITNNLKYLVVDNSNNQIEKKALELIKKKGQYEATKTLAKRNGIETNGERN